MNKILVSSLVVFAALGANIASAQSYYPGYSYPTYQSQYQSQTQYQQPYAGACVNLVSDLSYGSTGSQVRLLQTFLVSRNYPGGGTWMITGNFRLSTQVAVRNFQTEQGLPVTGAVDAATRAAIARATCGGSVYNNNNYNQYPYTYSQGYGGTQYSTLPTYTYSAFPNYN